MGEPATKSRSVLVCVCGGIAAYKVCEVVSRLAQAGVAVEVAMTEAAQKFVGLITFQALAARPVITDIWSATDTTDPQHIRLAQHADAILVAPATANVIGHLANGVADDLVSTLLLAADPKRVILAPAMNEAMWNHPAVRKNISTLQGYGVTLVGPGAGWQACRTVGVGRMSEPAEIVAAVQARLAG